MCKYNLLEKISGYTLIVIGVICILLLLHELLFKIQYLEQITIDTLINFIIGIFLIPIGIIIIKIIKNE